MQVISLEGKPFSLNTLLALPITFGDSLSGNLQLSGSARLAGQRAWRSSCLCLSGVKAQITKLGF